MSKLNLRVHIAPVGFEIDRIVMPAKQRRADKVYLMVHENQSQDKARPFVDRIKKQLKAQNIEVILEYHDRLDLFMIIKSIKDIIQREEGNSIYVNLASGSKIQAIAGMMACMMYNADRRIFPFYVEAKKYMGFSGQISEGIKDMIDMPSYDIQKPVQKHIDALRIIKENGKRLTKKKMAELADGEKLITVDARRENYSQARFASLDKNIIQPLRDHWKFIEEEKIGRTRWLKLTKDGENAIKFLI